MTNIEFLSNRVCVTFRVRYGGNVSEDDYVYAEIDSIGYIEIAMPGGRSKTQEERLEQNRVARELLVEWEVAEWKRIGPEDSELFLTAEWEERLAGQLAGLRGWETVSVRDCANCDHGTDPRTLTTCNECEGIGRVSTERAG